MRTGFFGGTFNPPHLGHVRAAEQAAGQLSLDRLLFIPTALPPHKELPEDGADADMRLEMLRIAIAGVQGAEATDMELRRGGRSYTADTVTQLKNTDPQAELWLLCGEDMFLTLKQWYKAEWLAQNVSVAVFSRTDGEQSEQVKQYAASYTAQFGTRIEFIETEPVQVSSTEIREQLAAGEAVQCISDGVYAYILKNRLYGVQANPDRLWTLVKPWLSEKRVAHVVGCRQAAAELARRWGADERQAQMAAILHDVTKKMSTNEQLRLCEKYGTIISNFEAEHEKTLHAVSGAVVAGAVFGAPTEVCAAVRWHTTGRADMTLLEKIIWLADYIEPNRSFEGVDMIRSLAFSDIDGAMELALTNNFESLARRGIAPHPATEEALSFLRKRG